MKIAILGAGAMGSLVGSFLQKGGAEVSLVDPYVAHMEAIRQNGLEITLNGAPETVRMAAFGTPDEVGPVDAVVVLVKGLYTESAVRGAHALFGDETFTITLQNGLGNDDILKKIVPEERILKGVMKITSQLTGPGKIMSNILADVPGIHLGALTEDAKAAQTAQKVVELLNAGGLFAQYHTNIDDFIWGKAVNNIAVNSACAIARCRIQDFCTHPDGRALLEGCLKEVIAVAGAKGVTLNFEKVIDSIEKYTIPKFGTHLPSTAQDVKAKRVTEIDFLNGAISRYGKELGIPTPINDITTAYVHIIQDNYENMF